MKRATLSLAAAAFFAAIAGAHAALSVGARAPDFAAPAALAGKEFAFSLADALKKGPVVVYFYPKSFTKVCTEEAHLFAEAAPEMQRLGAGLIGVSADGIDTQKEFSSKECRDAFPVAADPDAKVIAAYDAKMPVVTYAKRISYVVAQDGRIVSVVEDSGAQAHVDGALAALRKLRGAQ